MKIYGEYFYGNKISQYGLDNGYVDYRTLAKSFDAVLNNNIIQETGWEFWEIVSGFIDNSEEINTVNDSIYELEDTLETLRNELESTPDTDENENARNILQDRIEETEHKIDILYDEVWQLEHDQDETPEIFQYYIVSDNGAELLKECNEILYYNETLDMYVWGITHFGTAWDYVLTDIKIEKKEGE